MKGVGGSPSLQASSSGPGASGGEEVGAVARAATEREERGSWEEEEEEVEVESAAVAEAAPNKALVVTIIRGFARSLGATRA